MSSRHTSRYGLSQWEKTDKILMEDFNSDNLNIERALRNHDSQLLGVPTLGRNLYNLFLHQKKAGQDVGWMQGLVYDDFSDQSKIASMGEGISWSPAEKCVIYTPPEAWAAATLETVELPVETLSGHLYAWVRFEKAMEPGLEVWEESHKTWHPAVAANEWNIVAKNMNGEQCQESAFFLPNRLIYNRKIKLRFTINAMLDYTTRFYDYGLIVC